MRHAPSIQALYLNAKSFPELDIKSMTIVLRFPIAT